jgi:hypothetical protein
MAKLTEAEKRKNFERTVGSSENDMGPLPELEPKKYSPTQLSSKTPEPTFKSDVDNMVSGAKKFNKKIDDTLVDPVRKVISKAAGKEEQGILGKYSKFSRDLPEAKKKAGGTVKMAKGGKVSQLAKANGCAVRGKTRGKIC